MELSGGIIFVKDGCVLMGHATETPYWDIPKGRVEKGETHIQGAIRECYEETGFVVREQDLISLGVLDYSKTKNLVLFLYNGYDFPVPETCFCESTFVSHGRTIHEMDDFAYVPISKLDEYARPNMAYLLSTILG